MGTEAGSLRLLPRHVPIPLQQHRLVQDVVVSWSFLVYLKTATFGKQQRVWKNPKNKQAIVRVTRGIPRLGVGEVSGESNREEQNKKNSHFVSHEDSKCCQMVWFGLEAKHENA